MRAHQTALPITVAAKPGFVLRVARTVSEMWRTLLNRRAMRQLNDLTDWELVDIGLTREDIALAYDGPILDDPTRRLESIARARAKAEGASHRRS